MKKIISILLCCCALLVFSGCSMTKTATGEITDPGTDVNEPLVGQWTSTDNELTINRYIYKSGKCIMIIEDNEETYWSYTGSWKQTDDTIHLSSVTIYKYSGDDQKWEEQPNAQSESLTNFVMATGDNSFTCNEQLMTGSVMAFRYSRGLTKLTLPDVNGLTTYIVKYMD